MLDDSLEDSSTCLAQFFAARLLSFVFVLLPFVLGFAFLFPPLLLGCVLGHALFMLGSPLCGFLLCLLFWSGRHGRRRFDSFASPMRIAAI